MALFVQLFAAVPVTVYVALFVGVALTVAPVVGLRSVEGSHEYVFAPLAVKLAVWPLQILALFTLTVGDTFTVTFATAFVGQVAALPVTV